MENSYWRQCSSCKKEIPYSTDYYVCSVSTCKAKKTNYVFCSVPCFERHLPGARHKDAWAEQERSPSQAQVQASSDSGGGRRRIVASNQPRSSSPPPGSAPREILIVASKLKNYIKLRSDFNTSGDVMSKLSDMVRLECEKAIDNARADGRKTVMAKDFK